MKNSQKTPSYKEPLTPKQANIYAWGWQPAARFRTAVCGRRFGKTFLGAEEMRRAARLSRDWNISPDDEIWYGAPTFKQAKRVFWRRLKKAIPRKWMEGKPNESECHITLKWGVVIRIVGLDNYDNLRGSGLFFFLGDEWADVQLEAWTEVVRPMLSTCKWVANGTQHQGGHALFIGTPKGFNHFYEGYTDGQGIKHNAKSWLYTSEQGGNIPKEEIEEARRSLDARTFDQEYNASFVNFSGRIYYAFSRAQNVREKAYDPTKDVHIGMDFNVNPMNATVWQQQGLEWYQVDEIVIPTSNTDEMVDEIIERYGRPGFDPAQKAVAHISVYPDPAGAQRRTSAQGRTDISILRKAGFNVEAMSSHPQVRDRNNITNAAWCAADGTVTAYVDPRCRKSIEAYERWQYKEGTNQQDKEGGFDHLCEATGYFFYTRFAYIPAGRKHVPHMIR